MTTSNHWRLTAVVILANLAPPAFAGDRPMLSLTHAVDRALINHPALKRSAFDQAVSENERDAMAQKTPWALEAEVENFAGTGNFSGLSGAETTIGFSKLIERGDKNLRRTAVGNANVELAAIHNQAVRIEVAGNAAKTFMAALAEQRRLEIANSSRSLTESIRNQVQQRVKIGRAADAELATANIQLARAKAAQNRVAAGLSKKYQQVASALAEATPSFESLLGNIEALPAILDFESLRTQLNSNPQMRSLAQQQTLRTAELRLAEAGRRSDVTVGAGVRQLSGPDDTALVFSFSMPLGQGSRAAPRINAARNRQQGSPFLRDERLLALTAQLIALDSDLRATAAEHRVFSEDIIPLAEKAVALYQTGFDRGRYSLFELSAAQTTLLQARRDAIDAAERYQILFIDLQQLVGELPGKGNNR